MYYIDMRNKKVYECYNDCEAKHIESDFNTDTRAHLLYGEEPLDCMKETYEAYWEDYLFTVLHCNIISLEMEDGLRWLRCKICQYKKENE